MSKHSLSSYEPTPQDIFLLDTNLLIHLFYPTMRKSYMKSYETFFAKALTRHSKLILPAIQLSEFINRCIRFQFGLYRENLPQNMRDIDFKKDYRSTQDYHDSMTGILDIVKNDILKTFHPVDDHFSDIDTSLVLLYGFSYDFNDALLVQIADYYKAAIVTHDSDFANYTTKQPVITNNQTLLMFR